MGTVSRRRRPCAVPLAAPLIATAPSFTAATWDTQRAETASSPEDPDTAGQTTRRAPSYAPDGIRIDR